MSFKDQAVKYLNNYADILEFLDENRFKINAFRNASNVLRRLDIDVEEILHDGSIVNIKGIGKGIQSFLYELSDNGNVKEFEEKLGSIPDGLLELLQIRGLGVKKVKLLFKELKIQNIDDLNNACQNNDIINIKGFTESSQVKILEKIRNIRKNSKYVLLNNGEHVGASILKTLNSLKSIERIEISGEIRRSLNVISKIDIVISTNDINRFKKELLNHYKYRAILVDISSEILLLNTDFSIPIELHLCDDEKFIETLFRTTGSSSYLSSINLINLDEKFKEEIDLFNHLNLDYVIPEMREDIFNHAPDKLRRNSDLDNFDMKGLLHFHTDFSDGSNTLLEMAEEAKNHRFDYIAVCDHSRSAFYANGLSEDRVIKQKEVIKSVKEKINLEVFHGIESDILRDGSLDYSNEFMKNFDFVVASIHSMFNLSEDEMTSRIIRAIENPNTDVIGHPTGRLLLSRAPYQLNINKVLEACSENDVAIEINASPHRLDLDWRNYYFARDIGCKFAINPDAHSIAGIHDTKYGIKIAKKGGIQSDEVINYLSVNDFKKYLNRKIIRK